MMSSVERFTRAGFSEPQAETLAEVERELDTRKFVTNAELQYALEVLDRKWKHQVWRATVLLMGLVVLIFVVKIFNT